MFLKGTMVHDNSANWFPVSCCEQTDRTLHFNLESALQYTGISQRRNSMKLISS